MERSVTLNRCVVIKNVRDVKRILHGENDNDKKFQNRKKIETGNKTNLKGEKIRKESVITGKGKLDSEKYPLTGK